VSDSVKGPTFVTFEFVKVKTLREKADNNTTYPQYESVRYSKRALRLVPKLISPLASTHCLGERLF
jgi:hypothetical protein